MRSLSLRVLCLTIALNWMVSHAVLHAATNVVLSTDDLQSKIDAAAPGDFMVLEGGAYAGNISISKPLSFVRSGTNAAQWLGTVTVNTTGKVTMVQMNFSVGVTSSGGGTLLIQDSVLAATLNVTNGNVTLRRSTVSGRTDLSSCDFIGSRSTNTGGIYAIATAGTGRKFVMTQCVSGSVFAHGYKAWLAYNGLYQAHLAQSEVVFVGNKVTYTGAYEWSPGGNHWGVLFDTCTFSAYNNLVNVVSGGSTAATHKWILCFWSKNSRGEFANNTALAFDIFANSADGGVHARGFNVGDGGGPVVIRSCIAAITYSRWVGNNSAYAADGAGLISELSYSCLVSPQGTPGLTPYECIFVSPGLNGDFTPALNSPCLNAGAPTAFFKDRDGTRNDIGFTGGPLYQPNGATTSNPLLFWLMPAQRQVWKNLQPTLDIEAAATAGH